MKVGGEEGGGATHARAMRTERVRTLRWMMATMRAKQPMGAEAGAATTTDMRVMLRMKVKWGGERGGAA